RSGGGRCFRRTRSVSSSYKWYACPGDPRRSLLSRDEVTLSFLLGSVSFGAGEARLSFDPPGTRTSDTKQLTRSSSAAPKQSFQESSSPLPRTQTDQSSIGTQSHWNSISILTAMSGNRLRFI